MENNVALAGPAGLLVAVLVIAVSFAWPLI